MSHFGNDIRTARRQGKLPDRFRAAAVKKACPGWAGDTGSAFLPTHRLGNPGGNTAYFLCHGAFYQTPWATRIRLAPSS